MTVWSWTRAKELSFWFRKSFRPSEISETDCFMMLHVHTTINALILFVLRDGYINFGSTPWLHRKLLRKALVQETLEFAQNTPGILAFLFLAAVKDYPDTCLHQEQAPAGGGSFKKCNDRIRLSDSLRPHNNESIDTIDIHSPNRAPWVSPWAPQICESLGSCWQDLQRTSKISQSRFRNRNVTSNQTRTCWNQSCPVTHLVGWCGHLAKVSICQPKVTCLASGRRSQ